MNNEIQLFKKAQKIIRKEYGEPYKEFSFGCSSCEANLAYAWIEGHIRLVKWSAKWKKVK